jgi:DNA adenine methylase
MRSRRNLKIGPQCTVVPFLKWAGGKRWLTAQYSHLFPTTFDRYIEPFLGSGAVFFYLQPRTAVLSDNNAELINTYLQIRSNWQKVQRSLRRHQANHGAKYYYDERARKHQVLHEKAAQFIYLNRTCWNGLYRVNLNGEFNVPKGTKSTVLLSSDDFETVSYLLKSVRLLTADFETSIARAHAGDFVFVDPPYVTRHNFNGFLRYNDKIFSWDDQVRLHSAVAAAARRGVMLLVTNAANRSVLRLYRGIGKSVTLRRNSVLAADSNDRGAVNEVAFMINYTAKLN